MRRASDYHDVIKGKLKQLAGSLATRTGAEVKVFVDTAPIMEKPLAAAAGIGWQGKHTNLVSREHGSWLFLGAILTSAEIAPDAPEEDHCGSCSRCLDVCPTRAFPAPYVLDARRCLAYLTIEHKGHIPAEFRRAHGQPRVRLRRLSRRVPVEQVRGSRHAKRALRRDAATDNPPLAELLTLDDRVFRDRFAGTPIKRTGRDRFLRNVLIAAGNSGDEGLVGKVEALLGDASPLVRAMAVWAMRRSRAMPIAERVRHSHLAREGDSAVRAEWQSQVHELPVLLRARLQRAGARAAASCAQGWRVGGTARTGDSAEALAAAGFEAFVFDGTRRAPTCERLPLKHATHVLLSIPPDADGDPALRHHARDLEASPSLTMDRLSLDHRRLWRSRQAPGSTRRRPPRPMQERSRWRLAAEDRLARARPAQRQARAGLPPARHLRAGTQRDRARARGHGAAHRQARPGVQPRPCGRHRSARLQPAIGGARRRTTSTMSPTTSRRRRRT